jgi:excisionase family DNA binding protein
VELDLEDFDDGGPWVGEAAAAALLGVDAARVRDLIGRGALPAYRIGGIVRLRRADLAALGSAHR